MAKTIINESLNELHDALGEVHTLLEKLSGIPGEYPFLLEELDDAQDNVKDAMEAKDDDLQEVTRLLHMEQLRLEELVYYRRVLQDFCSSSHVRLPDFLARGLDRLCQAEYTPADPETVDFFSGEEEGDLPFWNEPHKEAL